MTGTAFRAAFLELPAGRRRENLALAPFTTYRTGGPARWAVFPSTPAEAGRLWAAAAAESVPAVVLGGGSNVLVSDAGFPGMVLFTAGIADVRIEGTRLAAGAGASLRGLLRRCVAEGLAGLEFLAGVPGTLGGAVVMNAGLRDTWISAAVESVETAGPGGARTTPAADIPFGYRTSGLGAAPVTGAVLRLAPADPAAVRREIGRLMKARGRSQPVLARSAGSVFRNPPGDGAGRLIEACGLKGRRVGGAEVSPKHANFIVNAGTASSSDIRALAEIVRAEVGRKYNVALEYEIRFIGELP